VVKLTRRRSKISGWGVFAAAPIPKGARIVEYKGELVSQREGRRREARDLPRKRIWVFDVNTRWARDAAVGGNIARYINHACRPNCESEIFGREIWISAIKPIKKGEELFYDYNTDGVTGIKCLCRPGCKRVL
jgi:SET domain-containing protein